MNEELSEEARDLIARARGGESEPSSRELSRIRSGVLAASLGAGTVLGSGSAVALGGKALATSLVATGVKGIFLGAVVAASATSASMYFEDSARTPSVAPSAPSAIAVAAAPGATTAHELPVAATTEPLSSEPSERATPNVAAAQPTRPVPAQSESFSVGPSIADFAPDEGAFAFELDVLRRAQAELRAERGARALALLDENAAALARGRLQQERLAVEVLAACLAGRVERARVAARRFRAENAATPAAARIRASCVGDELP
jgi:hypothetical protein